MWEICTNVVLGEASGEVTTSCLVVLPQRIKHSIIVATALSVHGDSEISSLSSPIRTTNSLSLGGEGKGEYWLPAFLYVSRTDAPKLQDFI